MIENMGIDYDKPEHAVNFILTPIYMLVIVRNKNSVDGPSYRPNTLCFLGLILHKSRVRLLFTNFRK